MKLTASQCVGIAIAVAVVIVGKHYYRNASADDLAWLLAPTSHLVSVVTGAHFIREAGVGWVDRAIMFQIAPVCAGCQFLFAGFVVLAIAWLAQMRTWRDMAQRLALAGGFAYIATLAVNTIRISIAVWMHNARVSSSDLHRVEGIIVYFGGLCALYAAASARRRTSRLRYALVPLAVYLVITIVMPMFNGAFARPEFGRHAAAVVLACAAIAGAVLALGAARQFVARRRTATIRGTDPRERGGTTRRPRLLRQAPR